MKKQTAVEWLVEQLANNGIIHSSDIHKAKEMEKEQIIESYNEGRSAGVGDYIDTEWGNDTIELTAEQYYNETFCK
jgi:hypothetical protein